MSYTNGNYSFECNRCSTKASDSSRAGIELFTEHHMQTVHPLFAVKAKAAATPRLVLTSRTPHRRFRLVR